MLVPGARRRAALLPALVLIVVTAATAQSDVAVVQTTYGPVRGKPLLSEHHRIFMAFLGVPFARPPLGDLRFRAPRPPPRWLHVREAHDASHVCPQLSPPAANGSRAALGDEDCLYLNVYAPWPDAEERAARGGRALPVLVWVHGGGGFASGGAGPDRLAPDLLMDHDVVLVVPQYRLGALGFLSTGDARMPGNYGLKDLVAALRWVRANARAFGGDARRVTAAGAGAGGALSHLLALAPASRRLLQRAAALGGSALAPWAFQPDPRPAARALVAAVGCAPSRAERRRGAALLDPPALRCLRRTPAAALVFATAKLPHWSAGGAAAFAPVAEAARAAWAGEDARETRLLPASPSALLRAGRATGPPLLLGAASGTSALLPPALLEDGAPRRALQRDLRDALQRQLSRAGDGSGDGAALTASASSLQLALAHYSGRLGAGDVPALADALVDAWLGHSATLTARLTAPFSTAPVFFLLSEMGPSPRPPAPHVLRRGALPHALTSGADVADLLENLQPRPGPSPWGSAQRRRAAQQLAQVLVAFAATGRPAPRGWSRAARDWLPLGPSGRFRLLRARPPPAAARAEDAPRALMARIDFWDRQRGLQRTRPPAPRPKRKSVKTGKSAGKKVRTGWRPVPPPPPAGKKKPPQRRSAQARTSAHFTGKKRAKTASSQHSPPKRSATTTARSARGRRTTSLRGRAEPRPPTPPSTRRSAETYGARPTPAASPRTARKKRSEKGARRPKGLEQAEGAGRRDGKAKEILKGAKNSIKRVHRKAIQLITNVIGSPKNTKIKLVAGDTKESPGTCVCLLNNDSIYKSESNIECSIGNRDGVVSCIPSRKQSSIP